MSVSRLMPLRVPRMGKISLSYHQNPSFEERRSCVPVWMRGIRHSLLSKTCGELPAMTYCVLILVAMEEAIESCIQAIFWLNRPTCADNSEAGRLGADDNG